VDTSILAVDKHDLDNEWVGHCTLVMKWTERAVRAKREWDRAKNQLELVRAELNLDMRGKPSKYGLPTKPAEKHFESAIVAERSYRDAQKRVINTKFRSDLAQGVVNGLEHRKRTLENLVRLHLSGFYSEPKAGSDEKEEMELAKKRVLRRKGKRRSSK